MKKTTKLFALFMAVLMILSAPGTVTLASEVGKVKSKEVQQKVDEVKNNEGDVEVSSKKNDKMNQEQTVESMDKINQEQSTNEEKNIITEPTQNYLAQLSYVYVDEEIVNIPETQNIVVSFVDETITIESAVLYYKSILNGQELTMEASQIVKNSLLFNKEYNLGPMEDEYELIGLSYKLSGLEQEQHINLIDENIKAAFKVTMKAEKEVSAPTPEVTTYTIDKSGTQVKEVGDSIEEAVASVLEEAPPKKEVVNQTNDSRKTRGAKSSKSKDLVVALSAGHDATHPGARRGDLHEEELTLKVSQYCKEELELYGGVTVILTRPTMACPYPAGNSGIDDIYHQINIAKAHGADVYVDIHFNTANGYANGAEIYYPNGSYNPSIGAEGHQLADAILSQLASLGLYNRGAKIKDATATNQAPAERDPAGNLADYFTTINYCKQVGIPGIIVEHAFIDNESDAARLRDENFIKAIGIADATGIANKYGLMDKNAVPSIKTVDIINKDEFNGTFTVRLNGVRPISNIACVYIPIWSEKDGQDDLHWYPAQYQGNNTYTVDVKISNHKNDLGNYLADAYIVDKSGVQRASGSITCNMKKASAVVQNNEINDMQQNYTAKTVLTNTPAELRKVMYAVWSDKNGQDDLVWYDGALSGPETWEATINVNNHKTEGNYNVHAYADMNDGRRILIGSDGFSVMKSSMDDMKVVESDPDKGTFGIILSGIHSPSGIGGILVPVWSKPDQSDMRWYSAQDQGNGTFRVNINISDHNYATGLYNIHAYLTGGNGVMSLVKTMTYEVKLPNMPVSAKKVDQTEKAFDLSIVNAGRLGKIRGVEFATWSEKYGQDDLVWYQGQQGSTGTWKSTAVVSNHRTAGEYQVHVYVILESGQRKFAGATTFQVSELSVDTMDIVNQDTDKGTFSVILKGIHSPSGIANFLVPVWCKADQSDIYWYPAVKQSDGSYQVDVSISRHNYSTGLYNIHAYVTGENGVMSFGQKATCEVKLPNMTVTATKSDQTEKFYNLQINNVGLLGKIRGVEFATWSDKNGQDDLVWYQGQQGSVGTWKNTAVISNHRTAGKYQVHVYVTLENGVKKFAGATTFQVSELSVDAMSIVNQDTDKGTFSVILKGIHSPSGIASFLVPVWCKADQSDIYWYPAVKQSDGSYQVDVSISRHSYSTGIYNIHSYLTGENGVMSFGQKATCEVKLPNMTVTATKADQTEKFYNLQINNVGLLGKIRGVEFAVWSNQNGQDDMVWYQGQQANTGIWKSIATINNHRAAGEYQVHTYVTLENGEKKFVGATIFHVSASSVDSMSIVNSDTDKGTFSVVLTGIHSPSGVKNLLVPIWSKPDQSDIYWYYAVKQLNGSYQVDVNISRHHYSTGIYNIHAYITGDNEVMSFVQKKTYEVKLPNVIVSANKVDSTEKTVALKIINAGLLGNARSVEFAVWSDQNGQDDVVWYQAQQELQGTWTSNALISNHKMAGTYTVHAYINLENGQKKLAGATSFKISESTADIIAAQNYNNNLGNFDIVIDGIHSISGVDHIQVPVWCSADRSDIVWYTANKIDHDTYVVHVDPMYHGNHSGIYVGHVYMTTGNGMTILVGSAQQVVNAPALYTIMGGSMTTPAQMVRYYNSIGCAYPGGVLSRGGASNIGTFCQIFFEEANAEGVRAEVAFTQAMLETGWLQFGGIVKVEQFNFCGLGATDHNGAANSAWFTDVRTGIRAQIQHLKAYGSSSPLNQPCVDPRFHLVRRECAPYVQWLGQKENPNGFGWATGRRYGYNIVDRIMTLKTK